MRSCSILISNYNSFETIELCIESIRKHTKYPHEIIVYDDCSTNTVDRAYLAKAKKKKWIKTILGKTRLNHGGAINMLLSRCKTDLAMILDNDIQILEDGWLEETVQLVGNKDLCLCGIEHNYNSAQPSLPDWMQTWFILLNMKAYRSDMEVDWRRAHEDGIMLPVGARLWLKARDDNPWGYRFIYPVPKHITSKYHHFGHISCIATESPGDQDWLIKARQKKLAEVDRALLELRKG